MEPMEEVPPVGLSESELEIQIDARNVVVCLSVCWTCGSDARKRIKRQRKTRGLGCRPGTTHQTGVQVSHGKKIFEGNIIPVTPCTMDSSPVPDDGGRRDQTSPSCNGVTQDATSSTQKERNAAAMPSVAKSLWTLVHRHDGGANGSTILPI